MKNLFIIFLCLLANSALFSQYIIKVSTENDNIYYYNQPITISLSALNFSIKPHTMIWTTSCEANYKIIGKYNWLDDHVCQDTTINLGFAPEGGNNWGFFYNNQPLPPGYYKIVGEVMGYGSDTVQIKVIDTLSTKYAAYYSATVKDSATGLPDIIMVAAEGADSIYTNGNGRFLLEFYSSAFADSQTIHPVVKIFTPYDEVYSRRITISRGDSITGPDIILSFQNTLYTVAGHIYYGNKETKPATNLFFYGINVDYGGRYYPDTSGNYSVKLMPGSYYVNCGINSYIDGFHTVRDRYYNNTPDFNKKDILTVNKDTSGIDFTFPALQMGTISGNVSDSVSKLPISDANIVVTPAFHIIDTAFTQSDQNGNYSIQVLEDSYLISSWIVNYLPEFYNGKTTNYWNPYNYWYSAPAGVDTIVVDSIHLNYSGINFHLIPSFYDIGGIIKDRTSGKVLTGVKAYLISVKKRDLWTTSTSDINGRYYLSKGGWIGVYFVLYSKDGYIDKYYNADRWENATSFNLNDTSLVPSEVDVYLTPADTSGGKISGNILLGSDSLLSYALVSAINSSDSVVSATISEVNGSYVINSLPDGDYIIQASKVGYKTTQYPDKIKIDKKSQPNVGGINIVVTITGVEDKEKTIPASFKLFQNYPNPFNPVTIIEYELPKESNVHIIIYNILGKKVEELVNKLQMPGRYEVNWDADNLASGVYFYTIEAGNFRDTKKLVLIK